MNEDRILNKLDEISATQTQTLVAIAKLQEQVKDVPDLKTRVQSLERWKWTAVGALAMSGGSVLSQLYGAVRGA